MDKPLKNRPLEQKNRGMSRSLGMDRRAVSPADNIRYLVDTAKDALVSNVHVVDDAKFVVSVGCGVAKAELELMRHLNISRKKLILVDPNPLSFTPAGTTLATPIDYPYTLDLVKSRPEVVNESVLILWNTDPDYAFYDMEAIHLLRPTAILIGYEANFTSASLLTHAWLHSLGISGDIAYPSEMLPNPDRWLPNPTDYKVRFERSKTGRDTFGTHRFRVALLQRRKDAAMAPRAVEFETFRTEFSREIYDQGQLEKLIRLRNGCSGAI